MSYISRCSICCILLISDRRLLSSPLHRPSMSHPRKPKPHVLPGEELPGSLPLPAASSGPAWGTGLGGSRSVHQLPRTPCSSEGGTAGASLPPKKKALGEDERNRFPACGRIRRPVPAQQRHPASAGLLSNQQHPRTASAGLHPAFQTP